MKTTNSKQIKPKDISQLNWITVRRLIAHSDMLRDRVHALEDAITEAGIMLSGGDIPSAMRRLGRVMGPDVLKRQGI